MSYAAEILADAPVGWWRLYELADTTLIDSSGHGYDGTYNPNADPTWVVRGLGGPIETESPSYGCRGAIGYIDGITSGHPLDVSNDFTWESWTIQDGGGNDNVQITRNGGPDLNTSNYMTAGGCMVSFNAGSYTLSYAEAPSPTSWYHQVVTRSGNLLRFYVNGYVRAERTDLPSTPMDQSAYHNTTRWRIGYEPNLVFGAVWHSAGTSNVAIYDKALSAARVLTHFESAKLTQEMAASITVYNSLSLESGQTRRTYCFLRHDWSAPYTERLSWMTGQRQSEDGHEQRDSNRQKPRRTFDMSVLTTAPSVLSRVRRLASANATDQLIVPFWPDVTNLVTDVSSGATTIEVDTQLRDFDPNSYAFLVSRADPTVFEGVEIDSLDATHLTFKTALTKDWAALQTRVVPGRRSHLATEPVAIKTETNWYEHLALSFNVLVEDQVVTPNRLTPWTPTTTFFSQEVFSLGSNNWAEPPDRSIERLFYTLDSSTGIFSIKSPHPMSTLAWDHRLLLKDRAEVAQFLGWLYARRGKQKGFWIPSGQPDFEPLSTGSGALTVKFSDYVQTYALAPSRRYMLIRSSGGIFYRRLDSVTLDGDGNEVFHFNSGVNGTVSEVNFLYFVRLDSDVIELSWDVTDSAQVVLRLRELLYPITS